MKSVKRVVGRGVASGVFLWICLAIGLGWGRAAPAATDLAVSRFQAWAQKYVAAAPSQRTGLEAEGLQLATARRPAFQKLIREDPKQALDLALPPATLELMPATIRAQLEYWVSGRAGTSLFSAGPLPEKWDNYRELLIHGQVFRAFVYGRRSAQFTFWDNPVYGVGMDNELAVAESPVWIQAEASASDPAWLVNVGGEVCEFGSESELDRYEQAILECEQIEMEREGKALAGRPTAYSTTATLNFSTNDLRVGKIGEYTVAALDQTEMRGGNPGDPSLPCKTFYVQIPAGAVATQITAVANETAVLADAVLFPAQPYAVPGAASRNDLVPPNTDIYKQAAIWPAQSYEKARTKRIRGQSFVAIRALPLRYNPGRKQVVLANSIKFKIDCAWPKSRPAIVAGGVEDMRGIVGSKLIPQTVPDPDPQTRPLPVSISPAVAGGAGPCDYLIITTAALRDAFDAFIAHRRDFSGFRVVLKTTEEIAAEYPSWPDGTPCPLRTSIRSCIRDYVHRGAAFVLLGGLAPHVPTFYFTTRIDLPGPYNPDLEEFCSDEYFASLSEPIGIESWPAAPSGWGFPEPSPRIWLDVGGYDSDVLVGRLPFSTQDEIRNYCQNVIRTETWPPLELAGKFLLVGREIFRSFEGGDRPGGALRDGHPGFRADRHGWVSDAETWLRRAFRDCVQAGDTDWPRERLGIFCDSLTSWDDPARPCGNYALTKDQLSCRLSEGWNTVLWEAHGGNQLEAGECYDVALNARFPALLVLNGGCEAAKFDRAGSVGKLLMKYNDSLNFVGYSGLGYVADDWSWDDISLLIDGDDPAGEYHSLGGPSMLGMRAFLARAFQGGELNVGRAFAAARSEMGDRGDNDATFDFYGYTADKMTLLGDPAVCLIGMAPQVEVRCENPRAVEGGAAPEIVFTRHNNLRDALVIRYRVGGTARPEVDFSTTPPNSYGGEITIPAGAASAYIRIFARSDCALEGQESISITLLDGPGYEVFTTWGNLPGGGEGTTRADYVSLPVTDSTGPYTLTATPVVPTTREGGEPSALIHIDRTGPADLSDALRFEFSVTGTATMDDDVDADRSSVLARGWGLFAPGQRELAIPVVAYDDNLQEAPETVTLQLLPARDNSYMLTGNPAAPTLATVVLFSDDTDPVVRLVQPATARRIGVGEMLLLRAEASDADNGVAFVEFYLDDRRVAVDATAPYEANILVPWLESPNPHQLRAEVVDNNDTWKSSSTVALFIDPIPAGRGTGILREQWNNLPGNSLNALFADVRFPQRPTVRAEAWGSFCSDGYPDWGEAYAERLRGYFLAPRTGSYRFLLQGNDYAELWLGTDENPAHKQRLASISFNQDLDDEAAWPMQTSAPVQLVAGRRYYVEALHKESAGYDWLLVGVELPGGQREMPIPGNRLDPWVVRPGVQLMSWGMTDVMESAAVTEGRPGQNYRVILNTEPEAEVRVNLIGDAAQLEIVPSTLIFTRDNWWRPQTATVRAVDDNHSEVSPQNVRVEHACSSADGDYEESPSVYLNVAVADNDINLPPQAARVWPKVRQVRTAATNVQICFEAQASDDGQPGPMTLAWSQRTGINLQTGIVSRSATTRALGAFSRTGVCEVVFTANDGMAQTNLDFAVLVGAAPGGKLVNFAPVVSAGPDFGMAPNVVTALRGTAGDDKLPANPGKLVAQWEKISGPGTVVFGDATLPATTIRAKTAGSYVLRLTAHDGEVKVFDDVAVTVKTPVLAPQ